MQPCTAAVVLLNVRNLNFQVLDSKRQEGLSEQSKAKFILEQEKKTLRGAEV